MLRNITQINIKERYSYDDFETIKLSGFNYVLPEETLKMISTISEEVGAPSYIKVPVFDKKTGEHKMKNYKQNKNRYKKRKKEVINDEEWNIIRDFQSTKMVKKEGVDSIIDSIRKHLNKMTDLTYDKQKEEIFQLVNEYSNNKEVTQRIAKQIFDIASNNKFYSKMYSKFCKDLVLTYSFMSDIIYENSKDFLKLFSEIEYCDPNEDYDKFCDINKKNDHRRSLSSFYVNLTCEEILKEEYLVDLLESLIKMTENYMEKENKKNELEEISENIYIIIKEGYELLFKTDNWDEIYENVEKISQLKPKDKKSLSNKTIFKFMDIVDFVEDQD